MSIFTGQNLTCIRGTNILFQDLSFSLKEGKLMALTGANGAGKTSLLRMIAGLLSPTTGQFQWNGSKINDTNRTELFHWIGPDNPLKPQLTVLENLTFWAKMMDAPAAQDDIFKALHRLELVHLADTPVQYLSVGQKRRAALCRLFLAPRPLWLLDEPASGLDHDTATELVQLAHEHSRAGGMVLVATHRPNFWQPDDVIAVDGDKNKNTAPSSMSFPHRRESRSSEEMALDPRLRGDDNKSENDDKSEDDTSFFASLTATIHRDMTAGLRHAGQFLMIPVFFVLAVILFPLALGPDQQTLQIAAPGLLSIAALFASLLPLERLFTEDKRDGTLDALMLCPAPLALYVAEKLAVHWILSGLPLILIAPLMALMLGLPGALIPVVMLALTLITLFLSLIGAIGAALTLDTRAGTVLLALTVVPLYIPALVFGAGAIDLVLTGFNGHAPLLYLGAMLALAIPLTPLVTGAILKMQLR